MALVLAASGRASEIDRDPSPGHGDPPGRLPGRPCCASADQRFSHSGRLRGVRSGSGPLESLPGFGMPSSTTNLLPSRCCLPDAIVALSYSTANQEPSHEPQGNRARSSGPLNGVAGTKDHETFVILMEGEEIGQLSPVPAAQPAATLGSFFELLKNNRPDAGFADDLEEIQASQVPKRTREERGR
jgi:hypothetical protein